MVQGCAAVRCLHGSISILRRVIYDVICAAARLEAPMTTYLYIVIQG